MKLKDRVTVAIPYHLLSAVDSISMLGTAAVVNPKLLDTWLSRVATKRLSMKTVKKKKNEDPTIDLNVVWGFVKDNFPAATTPPCVDKIQKIMEESEEGDDSRSSNTEQ